MKKMYFTVITSLIRKWHSGLSRLLFWGGRIVAVACVFFIVMKFYTLWNGIKQISLHSTVFLLCGILLFILSVVNYGYCYMWGSVVKGLSGVSLPFAGLAHLFAKSNLAKYLPGNVMHYVSRSIMAKKYGIPVSETALASLLDAVICALSAFLFAGIMLYRDLSFFAALAGRWLWTAAAVFFIALSVGLFFLNRAKTEDSSRAKRYFSVSFAGIVVRNIALYCVYYAVMSFVFYAILTIPSGGGTLFGNAIMPEWGKIAGLYTLAWLIGYLVPGASGGIGVREAMLMVLFQPLFSQETILMSAFLLRILSILSELLTYLFAVVWVRKAAYFGKGVFWWRER